MSDFERLYGFAERLDRRFAGAKRAVEVCTVQNYLFDLSEEDESKLDAQWRGIVSRAVEKGTEVIQVQLCETPVGDEMRDYLIETDAYFGKLGEKFRVISLADFERISKDWDLTDQFWVIDGRIAIVSSFAEDGELLGDEEISDKKLSREAAELGERTLAASLPPAEFIRKYK